MPVKRSAFLLALFSTTAHGEAPNVVAEIAPVHSLVAQVMAGVGTPDLLVDPTSSPHHYALRPSQGAVLEAADIVFWVSEELTPWLEDPLETLAPNAKRIELMKVEGTVLHTFRSGHDHDDHSDHDNDKDHEDHAGHGHDAHEDDHEEHSDHDDKAHSDHDGHDHAKGAVDPHGWLAPANAKTWLSVISETLGMADPANAGTYAANAKAAQAKLDEQIKSITAQLAPVQGAPYMVQHDAFQYFDQAFGLKFAGSIALGDATTPSPARVAAARETLKDLDVHCIFTEPQQSDKLVRVVVEGSHAKIEVIDATGARLTPGPDLYGQVLESMATSFASCLSD